MARATSCGTAVLLGALLVSCSAAPPYTKSKDFSEAAKGIKTVGVVIVEARAIEIAVGGSLTANIDKTEVCLAQLKASAVDSLKQKGLEAVLLEYDDEIRALLKEYYPVRSQLGAMWYRREPLGADVSLAGVQRVASSRHVDAVAFYSVRITMPSTGSQVMAALRLGGTTGESEGDLSLFNASGRAIYFQRSFRPYALSFDSKTALGTTIKEGNIPEFCDKLAAGLGVGSP